MGDQSNMLNQNILKSIENNFGSPFRSILLRKKVEHNTVPLELFN